MKFFLPAFRLLPLLAALAGLAQGCAGSATSGITHVQPPLVTANYEQVHVTGSHIPILVPTDPNIRRLPTISPLVIIRVDDLQLATGSIPFPIQ